MSTAHWFNPEGDKRVKICGTTTSLGGGMVAFYTSGTTYGNDDVQYFEPILRLLSSMTEEEKKEVGFAGFQALRETFGEPALPAKYISCMWAAKQTTYLLSKHFDLFNLIPDGLAIDAATI